MAGERSRSRARFVSELQMPGWACVAPTALRLIGARSPPFRVGLSCVAPTALRKQKQTKTKTKTKTKTREILRFAQDDDICLGVEEAQGCGEGQRQRQRLPRCRPRRYV